MRDEGEAAWACGLKELQYLYIKFIKEMKIYSSRFKNFVNIDDSYLQHGTHTYVCIMLVSGILIYFDFQLSKKYVSYLHH